LQYIANRRKLSKLQQFELKGTRKGRPQRGRPQVAPMVLLPWVQVLREQALREQALREQALRKQQVLGIPWPEKKAQKRQYY